MNLPAQTTLSLAKDKIRILLLEGINDSAVGMMKAAGYTNFERHAKALEGEALLEADWRGPISSASAPAPASLPKCLRPPTV